MDHGLETQIDLFRANDFRDVLTSAESGTIADSTRSNRIEAYAGIIGFENSDLDPLIFEVALGLGQVERCVVRRGVPAANLVFSTLPRHSPASRTLPVSEEGDLVSRHVERSSGMLQESVPPQNMGEGREAKEACPSAGIIQIKFTGISQINGTSALSSRRLAT